MKINKTLSILAVVAGLVAISAPLSARSFWNFGLSFNAVAPVYSPAPVVYVADPYDPYGYYCRPAPMPVYVQPRAYYRPIPAPVVPSVNVGYYR
jgi:hypothetical protein